MNKPKIQKKQQGSNSTAKAQPGGESTMTDNSAIAEKPITEP